MYSVMLLGRAFLGLMVFILSQLAPPKAPLRQIVIKQSQWLLTVQLNTVSPVLAFLLCLFPRCAPCFWHLHECTISDDVSGQRRLYDFPLTATLRRVTARSWHGFPVHDELSRGGSHPNTEYSDSFALP